jgi:hypothetical protein
VAKAAAFLQQCDSGDFTGLIWVWPGRGLGVTLLLRPVGSCLWRWRTVSSGWPFRDRPAAARRGGLHGPDLGLAGQRAWCDPATVSGRQLPMAVEDGLLRMVVLRPPSDFAVPTLSTSQVARLILLLGRESVDDGAVALEGGLHERLDGRAALRW